MLTDLINLANWTTQVSSQTLARIQFLICTTGKVNDAPITKDSLVASMLDPETMEYSIDIIIENPCKVINLKQILRNLKGPTSAAAAHQDVVENQNRLKSEAMEVANPIQTSSSNASTSTLSPSQSAKGKRGSNNNPNMCQDGLAVGDMTFSKVVEGDQLVKAYERGGHHKALEVAAVLESDEVTGSVKLLNYLKQWKKDHP
ncbi:hypothetical protein ARMGADRAFT_1030115 [Armillaria gallica]|uniref:Uncharacterized protein n=1 Tax=Armillaria gallica TaxID=47427 RepID=A0A2H3DRK8_ARMGA|nr:hypothetical protein ARMGADRAFT_1030115 [Armillaria gallica]